MNLQEITQELNRQLLIELGYRNISARSEQKIPDGITIGRSFWPSLDWNKNQITIAVPYSTAQRGLGISEISDTIHNWARELGCRLGRPFPLTSYQMEMPKGVHEVEQDDNGHTVIRAVTDYHLESDCLLTRFDLLVSWDETASKGD